MSNNFLTIYTFPNNKESFINYQLEYYRSRFPGCEVVVCYTSSVDITVAKNNCWKGCKSEWCMVVGSDEFPDIMPDSFTGINIIGCSGYDMYIEDYAVDPNTIGIYNRNYSKVCCWKPSMLESINYKAGAQECNPLPHLGQVLRFNTEPVKLYHFRSKTNDNI